MLLLRLGFATFGAWLALIVSWPQGTASQVLCERVPTTFELTLRGFTAKDRGAIEDQLDQLPCLESMLLKHAGKDERQYAYHSSLGAARLTESLKRMLAELDITGRVDLVGAVRITITAMARPSPSVPPVAGKESLFLVVDDLDVQSLPRDHHAARKVAERLATLLTDRGFRIFKSERLQPGQRAGQPSPLVLREVADLPILARIVTLAAYANARRVAGSFKLDVRARVGLFDGKAVQQISEVQSEIPIETTCASDRFCLHAAASDALGSLITQHHEAIAAGLR